MLTTDAAKSSFFFMRLTSISLHATVLSCDCQPVTLEAEKSHLPTSLAYGLKLAKHLCKWQRTTKCWSELRRLGLWDANSASSGPRNSLASSNMSRSHPSIMGWGIRADVLMVTMLPAQFCNRDCIQHAGSRKETKMHGI